MKKSLTILAFAAALVLVGCQREADNPNTGLKEIKFKASLDLETKVTATSFEEGDVIGLSIGDPLNVSRAKLTYTGGALTPEKTIFWPESMSYLDEATFIAWYPYGIFGSDPISNTVSFIVARDQYKEGEYESSDVLAALTSSSPSQDAVALEFHHLLSRFKIKVVDQLTSDSFSDVQSESFCSIGLNGLVRGAAANLVDGVVEADASSENVIYPMRASEKNYWAIVVPQTATPEIVVTLSSGKTRTYVPSAPITFTGGKQLSATLTLKDEEISFQWDIVDWEDDDTEIIFVQPDGDQPDNEIWYTSTDGEVVTLNENYLSEFGANLVSNTYENGKGVILFDGPITRVAPFAFYGRSTLLSVSLPESVTSLGSACFVDCRNLESIYLPNGITVIGYAAFYGCSYLSNVVLPRNLVSIEGDAFSKCYCIVSLDFPDSFENLAPGVFDSCVRLERFSGKFASQDGRCIIIDNVLCAFAPAGLTEYIIPAGVTGIGDMAFFYCSRLQSITIPDSVTEIGAMAFFSTSVFTFDIPDGVTTIGEGAFALNNSLKSFTGAFATDDGRGLVLDGELVGFAKQGLTSWEIPSVVTAIGPSVFYYCEELTTVTIPQTVTEIEDNAFFYCTGLQTITIPDNVTIIGNYAFEGCTALQSITIPQSVKRFGYQVFNGANSITEFYVLPTVPPTLRSSSYFITSPDYTIYVPAASVDAYKTDENWSYFADHIQPLPDQPSNEIWYTSTDGNIVEPAYPNRFGANVVSNTYEDGKGVIKFDGPVTTIGEIAFRNCKTLATIDIPYKVTAIEDEAFTNCESLSWPTIPPSVKKIGVSAFFGCYGLVDVVIPDTVTEFGRSVFQACLNLKSIESYYSSADKRCFIIDGVLNSFAYAELGETYVLPDNVTSIGVSALRNCRYAGNLVIGNNVTRIEKEGFAYAWRIKSIQIGENVTFLGDYAFYGFGSSGIEFELPASLTAVGENVFSSYLSKLTIHAVTPPSASGPIVYSSDEYDPYPIYVPAQSVEAYKTAQYWSAYADRIQPISEEQPNNEIWYTSTDGKVIEPKNPDIFGANIVSNTYTNGKGIILFDGDVTMVGDESVTSSDKSPYYYNRKLKTISLPESVKKIGSYVFCGCTQLENIHLPDYLDYCGVSMLREAAICEIDFPETEVMQYNPIVSCKNLSIISGPYASADGRALIKDNVLYSFAPAGITSYRVPDGVEKIGSGAFSGCQELESVQLSSSVTTIGSQSFMNCTSLRGFIIPDTVTQVWGTAFSGCTSLTSMHIPENTDLEGSVFGSCSSIESFSGHYASDDGRLLVDGSRIIAFAPAGLSSYTIAEGITSILGGFDNLTELEYLSLPSTMNMIYYIRGSSSIKEMTCLAVVPPEVANSQSFERDNFEVIYVPAQSVEAYKTAEYWSAFADKIQAIVE